MFKPLIIMALAPILATFVLPLPPKRFQGDTQATVFFLNPEYVDNICRANVKIKPTKKVVYLGCTKKRSMIVRNPCGVNESYAKVLCHELGHLNGWTDLHEQR